MKKDIRDFTLSGLIKEIEGLGEKSMRALQIFSWLNSKGVSSFDQMTNLSKSFRDKLDKKFYIYDLELKERLKAKDRTEKFLWTTEDDNFVETVLIREGKRRTLCVSTQIGCKFRCPFCASGTIGYKRDLRASEIVSQVLCAGKLSGEKITNIVFMGMGEPLDNIGNLLKAIRILNDKNGLCIGARKITVSTCGIIPGIKELSRAGLQIELSISLHAVKDALRNELVPINKKYPINELMKACSEYHKKTGRIITLEYTMIKDRNDSRKDAFKLAEMSKKIKAKVNLIPCNAYDPEKYCPADKGAIKMFRDILSSEGVTATVRKSKGTDILAACGQLAAHENKS